MNSPIPENLCDEIAEILDQTQGNITDDQLGRLIQEASITVQISDTEFRKKFEDLYYCSPETYRQNARDDALWLQSHG